MRKSYMFMGLLVLIVGLALVMLYGYAIDIRYYEQRGYTINTYQEGLRTTVSGYFSEGEILYFNFTSGRWWGGVEEIFEPTEVYEDFSIPPHKKVTFVIQSESGQNCSVTVYVVEGVSPFMIVFENKIDDLEPLPNGNLTFQNVGIECLVKRSGTYTVQASAIVPLITHGQIGTPGIVTYTLDQDPPRVMALWCVKEGVEYPYRFLLPYGIFLTCLGMLLFIYGLKTKRKRRLLNRRTLLKR